jgi:rhodanese-related sulfurtransferase
VKLLQYFLGYGRAERDFVSWIDADELKRRVASAERIAVIDVRETDEFTGPLGHIPIARNIPFSSLGSRLGEFATLAQDPIVLVCRTDKRSAKAAVTLREAGCSDVAVLQGGMEQWNACGFAVEGAATAAQNEAAR